MRFLLSVLLLICGPTVCVHAQGQRPGKDPDAGRARQLVRKVLDQRDYQVDFPGRGSQSGSTGGGTDTTPPRPRTRRPRRYRRGRSDDSGGISLSGGDSIILYVLIGISVFSMSISLKTYSQLETSWADSKAILLQLNQQGSELSILQSLISSNNSQWSRQSELRNTPSTSWFPCHFGTLRVQTFVLQGSGANYVSKRDHL